MKTKTNSVPHALIHFIARCGKAENWASLSHLGVSPAHACRVARLSAYETQVLGDILQRVAVLQLRFANLQECLREMQAGTLAEDDSEPCPETELCLHLFCHVAELYRGNERQKLRGVGLNPEQARLICSLSSLEVQHLAQHFWRFVVLDMHAGKLEQVLATAVGTARWLQQCTELVRAGAPRELMAHYYGMSCEMYAAMRAMHGLHACGRPRVLPDDVQTLLYDEFMRRYRSGKDRTDPLRQPGFFLSLYESMGRKVSLREIWTLAQSWIKDRETREPPDQPKS